MTKILGPDGRPLTTDKPVARQFRRIRARYDAAVTNDDNRRHWANADALHVDVLNSPETRRTLRNRARYEIANNSYARGIVQTLANDVIGTGPRLQMNTGNPAADSAIEREWSRWTRATNFAEKLRTMLLAKVGDGEAFSLQIENRRLNTPVKLDLRLYEADQISTPTLLPSENEIDGIEFDDDGNPLYYHVLRTHPGDSVYPATPQEFTRIPAFRMIHLFRADRPDQSRGIPEITPALPLFAQLRRYTLAVIAAAETAADFAAFLESDAPADDENRVDGDPFETLEIEQRMMMTLPAGWKASQLKAEQPTTTYEMFKREILNEIARCLNMPYNVAAGNSASYNYASGRLDHQTYFKSVRVTQRDIETVVLDRVLMAWLSEALLLRGYLPEIPGAMIDWVNTWIWDGTEHVDPLKEASAQAQLLANNTTTLARECARNGLDWEEVLTQRAKEKGRMAELGLVPVAQVPEDGEDDEDMTDDDEVPVEEDFNEA